LWKGRRERRRWRRVGIRRGEGRACEVNVKEVDGLEVLEELVMVLWVRERRGVGVARLERWKLERMVIGTLNTPRAPAADNVVLSILARGEEKVRTFGKRCGLGM